MRYLFKMTKKFFKEKSNGMDISFENTKGESPVKSFAVPTTSYTFNSDSHLIKENVTEPFFGSNFKGTERPGKICFE